MYLLDFKCMLDIVRYTKINIEAGSPDEVYPPAEQLLPAANTGFLEQCALKIPRIHFVDRASARIYASMESGRMLWADRELLLRIAADSEAEAALKAMLPGLFDELDRIRQESARPVPEEALWHILGDAS